MEKITDIVFKSDRDRYWVYIDNAFCATIRARTFKGMGLSVGQEISCEQVKEKEKFHWKEQYGAPAWEKEQVRLKRISEVIRGIHPDIEVETVGFGAGTTEFIKSHPDEAGKPDLEVVLANTKTRVTLLLVEVTGTEYKRGHDYWIRPDKLKYCQAHPDEDVWIALHYSKPVEVIKFVRPVPDKKYLFVKKEIRGSEEHYVLFDDRSEEVHELSDFTDYLLKIVEQQDK